MIIRRFLSLCRPPAGFPADNGEVWGHGTPGDYMLKMRMPGASSVAAYPVFEKQEQVWLHEVQAEFATTLYAFREFEQYRTFRMLINVDKVGGAVALKILERLGNGNIMAMDAKELKKLCGEKTGKAVWDALEPLRPAGTAAPARAPKHAFREDAIGALVGLGHKKRESEAAVDRVLTQAGSEKWSLQELIAKSLQKSSC